MNECVFFKMRSSILFNNVVLSLPPSPSLSLSLSLIHLVDRSERILRVCEARKNEGCGTHGPQIHFHWPSADQDGGARCEHKYWQGPKTGSLLRVLGKEGLPELNKPDIKVRACV